MHPKTYQTGWQIIEPKFPLSPLPNGQCTADIFVLMFLVKKKCATKWTLSGTVFSAGTAASDVTPKDHSRTN